MSEPTSRTTTANGPLAHVEESPRRPALLLSHTFGPTLVKNHSTVRAQVRLEAWRFVPICARSRN